MTIREFYVAVSEANINEELSTKARELIAALDAKNEKRKTTETKEKREAAARRGLVLSFFQTHPDEAVTRDAVAEAVGISPAQVSAACKVLLAEDSITKGEAKIDKARKVVYQYKA